MFKRRESICLAVVFFYLLPLLIAHSYHWVDHWTAFGLGLLSLSIGTLCLYKLMIDWESELQTVVPAVATPEPIAAPVEETNHEMERILSENVSTIETLSKENQLMLDQITHKEHLLEIAEQTNNDLRSSQERKQQRITQLETKVRDLSYEIKTLLQLTEIPESPPSPTLQEYAPRSDSKRPQDKQVQSYEEASAQLKRCIDIAQKITGASHYSSSQSRFRGMSTDNFALDLRCLFDSLRSENSCTIIVYSTKENKLLFANDQATKLAGWSPEKFAQSFDTLIQEGRDEWSNGIRQLASQSECRARLVLKSRSGEDILVHAVLSMIPTGIFRHHIIAVLYHSTTSSF